MIFHQPVMLNETVDSLACRPGGIYVDGTLGGGGHAWEILKRSSPEGILIGIDRDPEALRAAEIRLKDFGRRKVLVHGNFADIAEILASMEITSVNGILYDLGVSSHQLDTGIRGFSFSQEAPLDMRMDSDQKFTAADLVNDSREQKLKEIIRDYGEERMAGRIARAIARQRAIKPISTTSELASLICRAVPEGKGGRIHPATRTFQAIRIAVNNELAILPKAIKDATDLLVRGGRISIISFHSLEDRIVKEEFRSAAGSCVCPPQLPLCVCKRQATLRVLTKKPLQANPEEVKANPRARSAKLRTAERI